MKTSSYSRIKQKIVRRQDEANKQYKLKMLRDKRFGPNHEKYLRLKAFIEH